MLRNDARIIQEILINPQQDSPDVVIFTFISTFTFSTERGRTEERDGERKKDKTSVIYIVFLFC